MIRNLPQNSDCDFAEESRPARAFLKWAGSKKALLRHIRKYIPTTYDTYYEPFLGSGALFFDLAPPKAVLNDRCMELVDTFRALQTNADAVIRYLKPLKRDKDIYYMIRTQRSKGEFKRAAEFIYLNKNCWNGLYRVNSSGKFNVPYGSQKTENAIDIENIQRCSGILKTGEVKFLSEDFEIATKNAKRGDFVYFDPPYVTGHNNNGFVEYNETIFSWDDQKRLALVANKLREKGVAVVISNADHHEIRTLYSSFDVMPFERPSTLAGKAASRRTVSEIILHCNP